MDDESVEDKDLSMLMVVLLFIFTALVALGVWQVFLAQKRSAVDVLLDLREGESVGPVNTSRVLGRLQDDLGKIGVFGGKERIRYQLISKVLPPSMSLVGLLLLFLVGANFNAIIIGSIIAFSLGILLRRVIYNYSRAKYMRDLEFQLPLVMERIVMAVQAGFDVISAIKAVVQLEQQLTNPEDSPDGVINLLDVILKMTEGGINFEDSVSKVAEFSESISIKHAFIHLAVAYKEGGELVYPLSELSDATQLGFQETIEEDIAKMPVKATMPLVMTFAGLIIIFITVPLLQVNDIMTKAKTSTEGGR